MTKEEFFIKWRHPQYADLEVMKSDIDLMIQQAITEHEAGKWKRYPENVPEKGKFYWTHHVDGDETKCIYWDDWDLFVESRKVIAFRELPEPFKNE